MIGSRWAATLLTVSLLLTHWWSSTSNECSDGWVPFNNPILARNCVQCGPSTFECRFSDDFFESWLAKKLVVGDTNDDEHNDVSSDDEDAVDGVLNFVGENLLTVQEVTVCNRPLCSVSERGVRCSDVDLDAKMKRFVHLNSLTKWCLQLLAFDLETNLKIVVRAVSLVSLWTLWPKTVIDAHKWCPTAHPGQGRVRWMWLVAVIRWIPQLFVRKNHGSYLATNVIDVVFDAIVPNVRLNRFSMQMPKMHMAYQWFLLTMICSWALFLPSENQILYL